MGAGGDWYSWGSPPTGISHCCPLLAPPKPFNIQVDLLLSGALATPQKRMPLLGVGCSTARRN